ncbi:nucleotide-diphospho-sugar transferase [Lipomyces oligophaga]|uniref:nucleotide-diphospho-sugar transferase n=1 Tax=Lipomyces oligophaga TaxID=45792 RepID=UPI0034D01C7B
MAASKRRLVLLICLLIGTVAIAALSFSSYQNHLSKSVPAWYPPHIRAKLANNTTDSLAHPPSSASVKTASAKVSVEEPIPLINSTLVRGRRYAVASSVMTARFSQYAMMLAYSLQKYNDFEALDVDLILLVRTEGKEAVTPQNITRLERVGWKIMNEHDLDFEGVNKNAIRPYHRYNLNKLYLWSYTQYDRIVFIDADTLCKGSISELFDQPGEIAGSPDVWWDILTDTRFNSGVITFRPSIEEFRSMVTAVSDPRMHKPNDADQAFLNQYFKFRFHGLPYKYNFNIVMYQHFRRVWDNFWPEAVIVHFTTKKPMPSPKDHCRKGCNEWEPSEWYSMVCREMLSFYGYENELPLLG